MLKNVKNNFNRELPLVDMIKNDRWTDYVNYDNNNNKETLYIKSRHEQPGVNFHIGLTAM